MKEDIRILRQNFDSMFNSQLIVAVAGLGTISLLMVALQKPRANIEFIEKNIKNIKTQVTNLTSQKTTSKTPAKAPSSSNMQKYHQIMLKASKFKYVRYKNHTASAMIRDGHGDCWAMGEYLFNELKKAGFKVRIRTGVTRLSRNHRWNEIYINKKWTPVAYKKYKISPYFAYTPSVYNVRTLVTT